MKIQPKTTVGFHNKIDKSDFTVIKKIEDKEIVKKLRT